MLNRRTMPRELAEGVAVHDHNPNVDSVYQEVVYTIDVMHPGHIEMENEKHPYVVELPVVSTAFVDVRAESQEQAIEIARALTIGSDEPPEYRYSEIIIDERNVPAPVATRMDSLE